MAAAVVSWPNGTLLASPQGLEREYVLTLTVSTADGRSATTSATLRMARGDAWPLPPRVEVDQAARRVSASERLVLRGRALPGGSADGDALTLRWFVLQGPLSLDAGPDGSSATTTGRTGRNLVVGSAQLSAGATYRFRLRAQGVGGEGYADAVVVVNAPPNGGIFRVVPSEGDALRTSFLLYASAPREAPWSDDAGDMPLLYRYTYLFVQATGNVSAATPLELSDASSAANLTTTLPAGHGANSSLTLGLVVADQFGAEARRTLVVRMRAVAPTEAAEAAAAAHVLDAEVPAALNRGDYVVAMRGAVGLTQVLNARASVGAARKLLRERTLDVLTMAAAAAPPGGAAVRRTLGGAAQLTRVPCELTARSAAVAARLVEQSVRRAAPWSGNGSLGGAVRQGLGRDSAELAARTLSNALGARLTLRHSCTAEDGGAGRRALIALMAAGAPDNSTLCSQDGSSRCVHGACTDRGYCKCHAYGCMEGRCKVRWFKRLAAPCAIAEDACEGGMCQEYTCSPGVCVPGREGDCRQGHCVPAPGGGIECFRGACPSDQAVNPRRFRATPQPLDLDHAQFLVLGCI